MLVIALLVIPTALAFHRLGYVHGVDAGVDRVHAAIDASIKRGTPFTFVGSDVHEVVTIKTDSKWFRRHAEKKAARYELVRYRAMQEYGPDDSQESDL